MSVKMRLVECGECSSEAEPVNGHVGFDHAQRCQAWFRLRQRHPRLADRVTAERGFVLVLAPDEEAPPKPAADPVPA